MSRVRLAKITLLAAFPADTPVDLETMGDAAAEMFRDLGALTVATEYDDDEADVPEDEEGEALAQRFPNDGLPVGPVPGVKVLGHNGTFKRARLERKDNRIELWLGTPKERYPMVSFPPPKESK